MEFKPRVVKPVRIIIKKQPHNDSIRIEVKDKDNEGRKVWSFNLYGTNLPEVMKFLIKTFEKKTKARFPDKIKEELGILKKN